MDNIWLVHAGFGQGHKMAALSLGRWAGYPCYDLLDFCPYILRRVYSDGYTIVTDHFSFIWRLLFSSTKNKLSENILNFMNRFIFSSFLRKIKAERPRVVITTHFFALPFLAAVKKELNLEIIAIVTDFRVHPLWVRDEVDCYFVASEETKQDLVKQGIDSSKIDCGFVPLREGFLEECDKEELKKRLNLDDKPVLVFVSSTRGRFPFIKEAIERFKNDFNIVVIYGKNTGLKAYLKALKLKSILFFPFYERMWELFCLASIVITKPGGLTVFEGTYMHKPFIFTHYIPGQEEGNMELLIKNDVGRFANSKDEFMEAVEYLNAKKKDLIDNYPIKVRDLRAVLKERIEHLRKD